jgi:short-subunit dehydrogenase
MPHVAITGASSGIGAALVQEFIAAGYHVTLVARREPEMHALAEKLGGKTQVFGVDLTNPARCLDWLEPATAALGPIDILINNAGMQCVLPAEEHEPDEIGRTLALNLHVPSLLIHAVLPQMLARHSGCIVNISSIAAFAPTPGMWAYTASKAGIGDSSELLAMELASRGVHVLTVYPGPVETPMANAGYDAYPAWVKKWMITGQPDELARRIRTAIELKRRVLVYPLPYLAARWFPGVTRWLTERAAPPPRSRRAPRP